jgi:hypothetical protein
VGGIPLEVFLGKVGPWGLVSAFFLMMFFGRVVAKWVVDDIRKQRDEWQKTAQEALRQNALLLESAKAADATFKALQHVAKEETK